MRCVLSRAQLRDMIRSLIHTIPVTRTTPLCINSALMYQSTSSSGREIVGGACSLPDLSPTVIFVL